MNWFDRFINDFLLYFYLMAVMVGITGLTGFFEVIFGYMTSYSTYIHTLLYSSSLEALPPYMKIRIIIMKTIYIWMII